MIIIPRETVPFLPEQLLAELGCCEHNPVRGATAAIAQCGSKRGEPAERFQRLWGNNLLFSASRVVVISYVSLRKLKQAIAEPRDMMFHTIPLRLIKWAKFFRIFLSIPLKHHHPLLLSSCTAWCCSHLTTWGYWIIEMQQRLKNWIFNYMQF